MQTTHDKKNTRSANIGQSEASPDFNRSSGGQSILPSISLPKGGGAIAKDVPPGGTFTEEP
jgi:hypothetical protein